ncbi:unnamed protein product [Rotaria sordida]|uniref:RING-type domain-containing protein n=1 Tax=Rotaria sordida TaxID=392033 RepID=A0A815F0L6_9BILA|nr:unnamed protein product [Rotaria sordida]
MSLIKLISLRSFQPIFIRTTQTNAKNASKKPTTEKTNDEHFLNEVPPENDIPEETPTSAGRERSLNRIQLIGRVGADPKVGGTQKHKVITFNLATNEYAGTSATSGEIKQRVDWHRIAIFQPRLLENAEKYVRQGDRLYIHGRLHHNLIKDKQSGQDRYVTTNNIPVDRIDSPYRINIEEYRSTFKDGVYIRLETQIRCQLRVYWFVNIQNFYSELDSIDFRLSLLKNRFLKNHSAHQEIFNFETTGDYIQCAKFSDAENYLIQNNTTRREYPLVIVVHSFIDENSQEFFQLPIQVVTLHVKSSIPQDPPTKVIGRISKLANGQSLVVQDIYTPGAFISDDACAVCLTERVNHVLLPCKHACICQNCFSLIDKCPICQRFICNIIFYQEYPYELVRLVFLFLVTLLILFQVVQSRSVFPETVARHKRSLSNVNYMDLCMFRKSRLCNYLRTMDNEKFDRIGDDQEVWRRGLSQFYSNW